MGLAFRESFTASRIVARVQSATWSLAAGGFGVAGAQLWAGPTTGLAGPDESRAAAALVLWTFSAVAAIRAVRAVRPTPPPRVAGMAVDDAGRCRLRVGGSWLGFRIERAHILPGLILVALAPDRDGGMPGPKERVRHLLLGRDALSDDGWRRLNSWLRWLGRGRHDRPATWNRP
jgi:hypothetical protein